MEGIINLVCNYYAFAIVIAGIMAILTRVGNIIIRAFAGKEDWF